MNCGVVIVTYNRLELLKECVDCVRKASIPFSHIIIVDNCSTDGTKEYLEQLSFPELTVLHQTKNLGGAGGFYQGLKEAQGLDLDWVLIIDDDAMIAPDYMEVLLQEADREHKGSRGMPAAVMALAGSVWTDGRLDLTHRRRVISRWLFMEQPVPAEAYKKQRTFNCDCASFCGLVISGQVLKQIGLPRQEYFIWMDDTEYCLRLKPFGGILVVPAAKLNHKTVIPKHRDSLLKRTTWRHYYGYRNRYDTAKIHFGSISAFFVAMEYHVLTLFSRCMMLRSDTKEKGRFNVQMIQDALSDGKAGRLGQNARYHP
jgi:hypothetical protein